MSRQIAIAAFAAALAASPMLVTPAEAQNARRTNNALAIGLAAGVGGLLIGSAIANAQPRQVVRHGFYDEPAYRVRPRYVHDVGFDGGRFHREPDCIRRPIQRVDQYTGEVFIAGTRIVCR